MPKTLDEQLAAVEAAIERAENAQQYAIGGRQTTYAALDSLYKRRDQLQVRINRQNGGLFVPVQIDRSS